MQFQNCVTNPGLLDRGSAAKAHWLRPRTGLKQYAGRNPHGCRHATLFVELYMQGTVDQRKMGKSLREVAKEQARRRTALLGIEPRIVGVGQ